MAGTWSDVFAWPIIGIHAILTPDGKVLTYGTDTAGQQGGMLYIDVWDPVSRTHQTLEHGVRTDLFCSACVIVPATGEILLAGGDARPLGAMNGGVADVNVFDYRTLSVTPSPTGDMAFARWYGTPVTLGDGKILMLGGSERGLVAGGDPFSDGIGIPEVYTPGLGWKTLDGAESAQVTNDWWYPRAWLASDGRVILLQTSGVLAMDASGTGTVRELAQAPFTEFHALPSIMFDQDKVLSLDWFGRAWIMDISSDVPTFRETNSLGQVRIWSNMTLLADGSVMVSGGENTDYLTGVSTVYNDVAIWNPNTGQWTFDAAAAVPRLYHSTTLLLPDATVLSLGGGAPGPLTNLNGEIFRPGYLFDENGQPAERPEILNAPRLLADGQDFQITVDDAASIGRLTLVKFGAVTHSLNAESRMIELSFTRGPNGTLNVDLPDNENVVTPGYWMLFAFNNKGTPSVAATIHVAPGEVYSDAARTLMSLSGIAAFDPALAMDTMAAELRAADTSTGSFRLTDEAANKVGAMMSQARVDLSQDFAISFSAFLGANDRGGEGLAFLLHNDPNGTNAVGRGGSGLGATGIRDGIGFEIDTAFSSRAGDIRADHANFFDTDASPGRGRITNAVNLGNIEDGRWHNVELAWDADTRTLATSFDGINSGTLSRDIVEQYLGGSDFAYFGFTAASRQIANAQHIRVNSVQAVFEDTTPAISDGPFNVADPRGHVTLNGNASYLGTSGFRLTTEARGESGNIMSNERISLAHDFSISFNVFLGSNERGGGGMAFVLHSDPLAAGATGRDGTSGLGAAGIVNGLAIEFDTFNDGTRAGDIRTDHAAFVDTDGSFMPLARPINLRNVEDNKWHTVNVTWDVDTQTLGFVFDGQSGLSSSITRDLADDFFGGYDSVHFGWTAATGQAGNRQMVKVTAVDAVFDFDGAQGLNSVAYFDQL